ncbi:unnamed protein product [Albugo candida]|uniref:BRCT domain-containing protein n=1 Tax=Albugo candida TaxID=65357 RepID=A0A024FW10_9STRA|nr:unnamed protein product [Albugo candida]|eukprot:CCI11348.1 unnamed protein product [Albugo candida]
MLPPHLYRLYLQQQMCQVQKALGAGSMQINSQNPTLPPQPKQSSVPQPGTSGNTNAKLSERHLLILRREVRGCQELKRHAEACGATIAIEINSQFSDIISGMNLAETLKWLKLTKLPRDVEFHTDEWLREKIAEEQGQKTKFTAAKEKEGVKIVGENVSTESKVASKDVSDNAKNERVSGTDRQHTIGSETACIVLL